MNESSLEFLLHDDIIHHRLPRIGKEPWVILYEKIIEKPCFSLSQCAFLKESAISDTAVELQEKMFFCSGKPELKRQASEDQELIEYRRYDGDNSIRQLVIERDFADVYKSYMEIDEEFRLYHNLAENKSKDLLLTYDEAGNDIEVIRLKKDLVVGQLKYIKQFQAATGFYFSIFGNSTRWSRISLDDVPADTRDRRHEEKLFSWRLRISHNKYPINDWNREDSMSTLEWKIVIPPPDQKFAGIWPFNDSSKECEQFIAGIDSNGNNVMLSPTAEINENDLCPIFFRKQVLNKYLHDVDKYKVKDGYLVCCSLWRMRYDQNHLSHVIVFLKDLEDLPYYEQKHWVQYNVLPEGSISNTYYLRHIVGTYADVTEPSIVFKKTYERFCQYWRRDHGWDFFKSLSGFDDSLLNSIHVPTNEVHQNFDNQIIILTKLIIDSLNEKKFAENASELRDGAKGIDKLEGYLKETGFTSTDKVVAHFRKVQKLRSAGAAHRKGKKYERIAKCFGINNKKLSAIYSDLLVTTTKFLDEIQEFYQHAARNK